MDLLKEYIKSRINITDDILTEVISHFEIKNVKKNKFLIRNGQFMSYYYFIKSGGVRVYLNHNEKEVAAWFSFEKNFIVDIASLNSNKPSSYNIQAIEETELLAISRNDMDKLFSKYNEWQEFGRKLWENAFLEVVDMMIMHQTLTAEERYLELMKKSDFFHRIPLKQLSTFLGITPTSLSRIRNKIVR
ncbi:MAG: Crp/Fnr family transcriptional regulator [Bacteroidetes bacterium]|nr:MAG: Crp/Fnr family transcriptional regulator [Bacteroidota bacterium]